MFCGSCSVIKQGGTTGVNLVLSVLAYLCPGIEDGIFRFSNLVLNYMRFYCSSCQIATSGIVINVESECRWCPLCRRPLIQYPGCSIVALEKGILCEYCTAKCLLKKSKPAVDLSENLGKRRSGCWA